MVHLFWPQVDDAAEGAGSGDRELEPPRIPNLDTLEDRRLEVASQAEVDIEAQLAAVRAALDARS